MVGEEEWRSRTDARLSHIEKRLNEAEKRDAVSDVHRHNVEKRLSNIESSLTWLTRLIVGAIIAFLLNTAFGGAWPS